MQKRIEEILNEVFVPPRNDSPSKLMDLKKAISKYVKPGMSLYFPFTQVRGPYAASNEIVRQFWGGKPDFEIICLDVCGPLMAFFAGGMVRKVVTSLLANPYYYPAPCKVYQKAVKEGVELENCSLFTFTERIRAGAMGLPFAPTKSLINSTMQEEHGDSIQVIEDPFGSKQKLSLVKALVPDFAVVHAWAADEYGNTIITPPYGDGYYGAMSSRKATIVTAERIVSTDFIRKYAAYVKIPGYMVSAVCKVPFGAHPSGMYNAGSTEFEGYLEDYDFFADAHKAGIDSQKARQWVKEWILDCSDHDAYLRKLGTDRIQILKGRAHRDSWQYELNRLTDSLDLDREYNVLEMLIAAASRKLIDKAEKNDYKTLIAGAGLSFLSAGLAVYVLQGKQQVVEMMVEMGMIGFSPKPAEPFIVSHLHLPTCKMLTDIDTTMGIFMGGANNKCIGMLGAAQIDKYGNINTSRIGDTHLLGSGGSNGICSAAREVVALAIQSPGRVVGKVDYVTSPGDKVTTLITNLGVFEKLGENNYFTLTGYFPDPELSPQQRIEKIKANCGWDLEVSPEVAEVSPPTLKELHVTRLLDPQGYHIGKEIASRLNK